MPPSYDQLKQQLSYSHKQTTYAWSQYYKAQEQEWETHHAQYAELKHEATNDDTPMSPHLVDLICGLYEKAKAKVECPICLEVIETAETLKTGKCGHNYHKECIEGWRTQADTEAQGKKCPICRKKY